MATFQDELGVMLRDITSVMGRTVTLTRRTAVSINPSTLAPTATTASITVPANLTSTDGQPRAAGQGTRQRETRVYEIRSSLILQSAVAVVPEKNWILTDEGVDLEVIAVDRDTDLQCTRVTCTRTL